MNSFLVILLVVAVAACVSGRPQNEDGEEGYSYPVPAKPYEVYSAPSPAPATNGGNGNGGASHASSYSNGGGSNGNGRMTYSSMSYSNGNGKNGHSNGNGHSTSSYSNGNGKNGHSNGNGITATSYASNGNGNGHGGATMSYTNGAGRTNGNGGASSYTNGNGKNGHSNGNGYAAMSYTNGNGGGAGRTNGNGGSSYSNGNGGGATMSYTNGAAGRTNGNGGASSYTNGASRRNGNGGSIAKTYSPPETNDLPTPSTYDAYAPPPPSYETDTRIDSQGVTATCEPTEVAPGSYEYVCNASPGTLVEERTLWIPTSGQDQELVIRVPNYQFREIIRAGLQGGAGGGTNVRVHVARPEIESVVEGRFDQESAGPPNVQISYDGLEQRGEVHYGGSGLPYSDLSKPIVEPGLRRRRGY